MPIRAWPVWRSQDLVNWQPLGPTLTKPVGSVWAPELVHHGGRFYNYFHARTAEYRSLYVITAEQIEGPWSDPFDLKLHAHIDPGHAVGEDGRRYLFLSGGDRVRLTDDGLATDGAVEHVYDPWRYPPEWDVETFAPEGPKVLKRGDWFYLILAVGGTAGPPTGHMVIVARSRSIHGPWENAPNNPIVRTVTAGERWWSRGHATAIAGPDGSWWLVYHGYENGFWTLGRQTLLDPCTGPRTDGWSPMAAICRSRCPSRAAAPRCRTARRCPMHSLGHGLPHSGRSTIRRPIGVATHALRKSRAGVTGKGTQPRDASPLCFIAGDPATNSRSRLKCAATRRPACCCSTTAGCIADSRSTPSASRCIATDSNVRGQARRPGRRLWLRIENDRHIVTLHHSPTARPGPNSTCRWRSPDTTTTSPGTS